MSTPFDLFLRREKEKTKDHDRKDKCCGLGWDHIHILMQTLVVTGGFLLMTLYKAIWYKYGRKIKHWEEALITFLGSFFLIYLVYLIFNRRIVTAKIYKR